MCSQIVFLLIWGIGCACLDSFGLVKHPAWFYALGACGMALSNLL